MTSGCVPFSICLQFSHSPHGLGSPVQLTALANNFATVVFPVPRGPQNKYACAIFFSSIACFNVVIIASCPATSLNVCGRYVLYNDLYAIFINSFPYYT